MSSLCELCKGAEFCRKKFFANQLKSVRIEQKKLVRKPGSEYNDAEKARLEKAEVVIKSELKKLTPTPQGCGYMT